jgi:uncharacterized membrane protein YphA (DoxX/SURF4 family)
MSQDDPSEPDPLFLVVLKLLLAVLFVMAAIGMLRHGQWRYGSRGHAEFAVISRVQHPVLYWLGPILALGGAVFLVAGRWIKRWWTRIRRPPE